MRAQSLRHQVTIKRPQPGQDANGQPLVTWVQVGPPRRASILHNTGLATLRANAQTSTVKASIRIRHCTDIRAGMRVHHGAVIYEVRAVLPDEERRDHVDLVVEQVG